jgi:hypothetical protein
MIRQRLELMVGAISDSLFIDIMKATKADIMFNRVEFMQRTTFDSMIGRAVVAYRVFVRCIDRCPRCDTKDNHAMANYCTRCGVQLNR